MIAVHKKAEGPQVTPTAMPLRDPHEVMRLSTLGAMHFSRLSFSRSMIRTMRREGWKIRRIVFDLDYDGFGHAIYRVDMGGRVCSLVAFSHYLPPDERIDRVIATAWDTSYVLYDGVPDVAEIARLRAAVPRQEAARYSERELILARANRSVRLFDETVAALAAGGQPDRNMIRETGYFLRTSAVYGNGKFGIADRARVAAIPGLETAFAAEMLTVWLIRAFSADLVEHCARMRAPATAAVLEPGIRRDIGIGNSTGLGMAPFLIRHPVLLDAWVRARETALARVRALPTLTAPARALLQQFVALSQHKAGFWVTSDAAQSEAIRKLREDLPQLAAVAAAAVTPDEVFRRAGAELGIEASELTISLLIDAHPALSDDLPITMVAEEEASALSGDLSCADLRRRIGQCYDWALALDFTAPGEFARFWYTSQEKLEPRIGWRGDDEGEELAQPLGIAWEIRYLADRLAVLPGDLPVWRIAQDHPELRHSLRRVEIAAGHGYGELHENLLGTAHRPSDLMRCKLSFLGCEFFDPASDLSVKVRFFHGAPFPDDLSPEAGDGMW
ncbi:MAG: hypothetical protein LBE86_07210 [Gemmobacter sp.]|jgi:hypothetical protein|nr:hypothetical protein [Gemmobacter sp.]